MAKFAPSASSTVSRLSPCSDSASGSRWSVTGSTARSAGGSAIEVFPEERHHPLPGVPGTWLVQPEAQRAADHLQHPVRQLRVERVPGLGVRLHVVRHTEL